MTEPLPHTSTAARATILAQLRAARADQPAADVPEPAIRRFDWDATTRRARFTAMLQAVQGEVHAVGEDWPARLAAILRGHGATNLRYGREAPLAAHLVAGWPADGPRLIPHDQPIEACRADLFDATDAALTGALAGIAETGSLVLAPTPAEPRLLSLVPPIHCVLLDAADLLTTLHEWLAVRGWIGTDPAAPPVLPSNLVLISGPSKSADIEQTLTYGVHGPRRLIVLLQGADPGDPDPPGPD